MLPITRRLCITLLLAGCATFQSTPAQDRVWAARLICESEVRGLHVSDAARDGAFYVYSHDANPRDVVARGMRCMERELSRPAQPRE